MKKHISVKRMFMVMYNLVFLLLAMNPVNAQIPSGIWYCIEGIYQDSSFIDFDATFSIDDNEYYSATFGIQYQMPYGRSNTLYQYSASGDTLITRMPQTINLSGGASNSLNGKKIYDYYCLCSQNVWDKAGQVALGWGYPPGATMSKILFSVSGDTLLELKSVDQKCRLIYTLGAKRPAHNPVVFGVNMKVQQQLGNFNAANGDQVIVRGSWSAGDLSMEETTTPGIYQTTLDFPGSEVQNSFDYKYVIQKSGGSEIEESDPVRNFTLEGHGNDLGVVYFNRQARADEVVAISVSQSPGAERTPATAYNPRDNEFLTVWTDASDNIVGQRIASDGDLEGAPFSISNGTQSELFPQVEYNTRSNEWLIVWQDNRNGNWDIYGIRLSPEGKKRFSVGSESDSSFSVCRHDSLQYTPRVAYNDIENNFLVVWLDYRNRRPGNSGYLVNIDVYGQRVTTSGTLMDAEDIPIAFKQAYDEIYPDVAYCGTAGKTLNEWLVVFARYELGYSGGVRIWGVRIDGQSGLRLDTWGVQKEPGVAKSLMSYAPPFLPEFPIGWDEQDLYAMLHYHQGSPHVESNDDIPTEGLLKTSSERYPIPEFLVSWTESRKADQDIYCQRIAYFPDSAAYRLGLKPDRGEDGLFTAVLLDQNGDWPEDPASWITWPNFLLTEDDYEQSWNNISYCANDGSYLIVWNDWRNIFWNGQDYSIPHPADIYGQRAYLNPEDSSLAWIDHDGSWTESPLNVPLAFTDANEGNTQYPAIAFGVHTNAYLVAYEYTETDPDPEVDIVANLYQGALPDGVTNGVNQKNGSNPKEFVLCQNYPNPFNPDTRIDYVLNANGRVTLKIYDMLGREIRTLIDEPQTAGNHQILWNGNLSNGTQAASGLYIARLTWANNGRKIALEKKMILLR